MDVLASGLGLSSSLRPEGGISDFLPTTLLYKRRVKKQQERLEAQRRALLEAKRRAREEAEERKREEKFREAVSAQISSGMITAQQLNALQQTRYSQQYNQVRW